eukprot:2782387-Alexandrium_andersonii.AAC.1
MHPLRGDVPGPLMGDLPAAAALLRLERPRLRTSQWLRLRRGRTATSGLSRARSKGLRGLRIGGLQIGAC